MTDPKEDHSAETSSDSGTGYVPFEGVSPAIKGMHAAAYVAAHHEASPDPDYDDSDEDWADDEEA